MNDKRPPASDDDAQITFDVINATERGVHVPRVCLLVHGRYAMPGLAFGTTAIGVPPVMAVEIGLQFADVVLETTSTVDPDWLDRVIEHADRVLHDLRALRADAGKTERGPNADRAKLDLPPEVLQ